MVWPIAQTKADFDAATDDPKQARGEFSTNVDRFNELQAHVVSFMQTFLTRTTAALARTDLDAAALTVANTFTKTQTWTKGTDVVAAAALSLGDGNWFDITGTTTITSIGTKGIGTVVVLQFDAALVLTHNATDLVLPAATNITTAAGDIAVFYEYATADWRLVSYQVAAVAVTGSGKLVQVVNTQDGAVATGTTVTPTDDTIPQNTEGDEYMTLAITPANSSNILYIESVVMVAHTAGGTATVALHQDATAGALAVGATRFDGTGVPYMIGFRHKMTAGTTSATTFKIRVGSSAAGTVTFNGIAGGRLYAGVAASSITITEVAV